MVDIADCIGLAAWIEGKPPELACILAARTALRVAPVLGNALCEDADSRRRAIVLSGFRALAAASCTSTWPKRAAEIRKPVRVAAQEAMATVSDVAYGARLSVVEWTEAAPEEHESIWGAEADARSLGIVEYAVDAAARAVGAAVDMVDAERGIASFDSVYEEAVAAVAAAYRAVDGIHEDGELFNESQENDDADADVAEHIAEFWKAVKLDVECLEADTSVGGKPEAVAAGLMRRALWLDGIPVWAGRRWAEFKDKLPDEEGWRVWIDWYEARLVGRAAEASLEFDRIKIPKDDWEQGPAHVNAIISKLIEAQSDPLLVALSHGFEELEAVRQVSSIDLTQYAERLRHALPNDPSHAVGITKDMLEATMKTILHHRGCEETVNINFAKLMTRCLSELGLTGTSSQATDGERYARNIASSAQKMMGTVAELRNRAGTGHGRVIEEDPVITGADANLVASTGLILAAWLLHHMDA